MIIGRCSICGGRVEVQDAWYGIDPPNGTCRNCGAVKKDALPIVDMQPRGDSGRWVEIIKRLKD